MRTRKHQLVTIRMWTLYSVLDASMANLQVQVSRAEQLGVKLDPSQLDRFGKAAAQLRRYIDRTLQQAIKE